jgi:lipopolysaccharide export LptBFGC system permease protein LptF
MYGIARVKVVVVVVVFFVVVVVVVVVVVKIITPVYHYNMDVWYCQS